MSIENDEHSYQQFNSCR